AVVVLGAGDHQVVDDQAQQGDPVVLLRADDAVPVLVLDGRVQVAQVRRLNRAEVVAELVLQHQAEPLGEPAATPPEQGDDDCQGGDPDGNGPKHLVDQEEAEADG